MPVTHAPYGPLDPLDRLRSISLARVRALMRSPAFRSLARLADDDPATVAHRAWEACPGEQVTPWLPSHALDPRNTVEGVADRTEREMWLWAVRAARRTVRAASPPAWPFGEIDAVASMELRLLLVGLLLASLGPLDRSAMADHLHVLPGSPSAEATARVARIEARLRPLLGSDIVEAYRRGDGRWLAALAEDAFYVARVASPTCVDRVIASARRGRERPVRGTSSTRLEEERHLDALFQVMLLGSWTAPSVARVARGVGGLHGDPLAVSGVVA